MITKLLFKNKVGLYFAIIYIGNQTNFTKLITKFNYC